MISKLNEIGSLRITKNSREYFITNNIPDSICQNKTLFDEINIFPSSMPIPCNDIVQDTLTYVKQQVDPKSKSQMATPVYNSTMPDCKEDTVACLANPKMIIADIITYAFDKRRNGNLNPKKMTAEDIIYSYFHDDDYDQFYGSRKTQGIAHIKVR